VPKEITWRALHRAGMVTNLPDTVRPKQQD